MEHLWKFASKHSIEIDDDVGEIELLGERDCTLTKKFSEVARNRKITRVEWTIANKCRIYKQVCTVSDVATGDGNRIEEWVFNRNSPED